MLFPTFDCEAPSQSLVLPVVQLVEFVHGILRRFIVVTAVLLLMGSETGRDNVDHAEASAVSDLQEWLIVVLFENLCAASTP